MRHLLCAVAAGLLLLPAPPAAGADDFLRGPRDKFEAERAELDEAYRAKEAEAGRRYIGLLRAMIRYMEQSGDEYGVRPAQAEIERFEAEGTVPAQPALGTPELMAKAQAGYHRHLGKAKEEKARREEELARKYLEFLEGLRRKLEASSKTEEAARVTAEMERVSEPGQGEAPDAGAAATKSLFLPRHVAANLLLAYTFAEDRGREVRDLSGQGRHGDVLGAKRIADPVEGPAYLFAGDNDSLEIEPIEPPVYWTLLARVRFPLAGSKREKVLLSSAYRRHYVVVDGAGDLGVEEGTFTGSGYNVGDLRGWHDLGAVASRTETVFYVDGKPVGRCKAACGGAMTTLGNSAAGGRPWTGAVGSVLLWRGTSSNEQMARIYRQRDAKAGGP